LGHQSVEVEHVVLGVLQADLPLSIRLFKSQENLNRVLERLAPQTTGKEADAAAAQVEIPLSRHCVRVMSYAAGEAERLDQKAITSEHLLLGVLRENTSIAAGVVREEGVTASQLNEIALQSKAHIGVSAGPLKIDGLADLVSQAGAEQSSPLVGRKRELDQLMQILSRRTKNSAVLLGEPGVGKNAVIRGLAQRIFEGNVPADLRNRQIYVADASELLQALASTQSPVNARHDYLRKVLFEISDQGGPILCVRGLFDYRDRYSLLASYLKPGKLQIIATGAPLSFRLALERSEELARQFEPIGVLPPTEAEAVEIIAAGKEEFEKFHGVAISLEAIQTAVSASGRFMRHQVLPDRAIDLIDDAGAMVKLRKDNVPPEILELKRKVRRLLDQSDRVIVTTSAEQADVEKLTSELRRQQDELAARQEEFAARKHDNNVTPSEIFEVVAARTSLSVDAVRSALDQPPQADAEATLRQNLAKRIPVGQRDWLEGLLAYLRTCSNEDADHLAQMIRSAHETKTQ
jgi:ATP-dependent Clp protease ATP-binding subunit ClpC